MPQTNNKVEIYSNSSSNIPSISIDFEGKKYLINATSTLPGKTLINEELDAIYFSQYKADHMWNLLHIINSCKTKNISAPKN